MSFVLYFVILVVVAASTLFGIDFMAPQRPMPDVPIGRAAHLAYHKPKRPAEKQADARALSPVYPAAPGSVVETATTGTGNASPTPPNSDGAQQAAAQPETDRTPAKAAQAAPQQTTTTMAQNTANTCDVQACSSYYRSFRASDCTYQPYGGPRRLCDKSGAAAAQQHPAPRRQDASIPSDVPPMTEADAEPSPPPMQVPPEIARIVRRLTPDAQDVQVQDADGRILTVHVDDARDQARCDVAACSAAYGSFDPADCTYQPYDGPRRLCTK
jgi:BA14K-like protein